MTKLNSKIKITCGYQQRFIHRLTFMGLMEVIQGKVVRQSSLLQPAKFSFRLVENQNPDEIEKLVSDFIKNNLPKGTKYTLKISGKLDPFCTDINNKYAKATDKIFTSIFGKKTLFSRSGGSIGAVATLAKIFKKPLILTGFTLSDCNIHAPNENINENMFFKGIVSLEKIFSI